MVYFILLLLLSCFLYFGILKQFLFPRTIILTEKNIDQVVKLLIKYFGSNYYVKRHAFDQNPYKKINWYVGFQKEKPDIIEKDNSISDNKLFIRMRMGFGRGNLIKLGAKIIIYKNKIRIYQSWEATNNYKYIVEELKKCELKKGDLEDFEARNQFQKDIWNEIFKKEECYKLGSY